MWELIANSFLSTIPVFVFFAIGYRLRSQGSLAPEHDGPIMQLAMDVGYPCLVAYWAFAIRSYARHRTPRYVCGRCGAALPRLGRCPHCGALNQ